MALTLEEFLPKARQLNPDYTDDEHIQAYEQRYGRSKPVQTVSAAPLTTYEEFLPKARALNPDYSDEEHYAAWQEKYGARGAKGKDQGDLARGFKESFQQLPQMAAGVAAGAGALGEKMFGEGGLSTALKNTGLKHYREIEQDIAQEAKPSDSISEAYNMARAGNPGALVDWLQHGIGSVSGQGLQALATAGIGTAVGKLALKPAAETLAQKLIAKEAARIGATSAGAKLTAQELTKQATSNVAGKIGQVAALGAMATGMEGGEIHGDLVSQAEQEGRSLTGYELAKAFATTLGAGALEFIGDKFGVDLLLGKSVASRLAKSRVGNAAAGATVGAVVESGTEALQTPLEQIGKGQDPTSPESVRETVDSAALGFLGGTGIGGGGGIIRRPEGQVPEPVVTERQPDEMGMAQSPETQPEVLPPQQPAQIEGPIQPGEVRGGKVYGDGPVMDVSPLPDVSPVLNASSLDDAIASAVGVVRGATETGKARAAEFARMTAKAKNETDALLANAPEKRAGSEVPIIPGPSEPVSNTAQNIPQIIPGSAFTPRAEPVDDPRARLAEERARMVAQREQQRLQQPVNPVSEPVAPAPAVEPSETPLPSQVDLAYPSSKQVRDLIHEKGFHLDTPVFREYLKMAVGKEKFSDLTPQELQRLAEKVQKIKAPQQPTPLQEAPPKVPLTPTEPKEKPYAPVTTIPEAQVPRSELTPEKNAEMLLRAEKAKADMEIAGTERGGRFFQDQPGAGSTQEVTGLKSATADWYKELTSGPSPAIRGDRKQSAREKIEVAIAKIIKDQGADRGKAVEQVKAALLQDTEFHQTEWGRDLNSIMQGEWPSWIEKPQGVSAKSVESPKVETQPVETAIESGARQEFQNVPRSTPEATVEEPKKVPLSRKERLAQQKQKMEAKKPEPSPSKAPAMESQPATASPEREPAPPAQEAAPTPEEPFSLTAPEVSKPKAKDTGPEQLGIEIPPETIGSRPIIGREATHEEAPLFSKAAQEKDPEQISLDRATIPGMATDRGPGSSDSAQTPPEPGRDITNTPAFKEWFGNSKVVDENGDPLLVYHGTNDVIEIFDPAKRGDKTHSVSATMAFFFTDNIRTAQHYLEPKAFSTTESNLSYVDAVKRKTKEYKNEDFGVQHVQYSNGEIFGYGPDEHLKLHARIAEEFDKVNQAVALSIAESGFMQEPDPSKARPLLRKALRAFYPPSVVDAPLQYLGIAQKALTFESRAAAIRATNEEFGKGNHIVSAFLRMGNPKIYTFRGGKAAGTISKVVKDAIAQGFDGVIFRNVDDGGPVSTHYAVFSNEQIRQASPNSSSPQQGGLSVSHAETATSEPLENPDKPPVIPKQDSGSSAQSPTEILADALRTAADKIAGKKETKAKDGNLTDVGEELWYNKRNRAGKGINWNDVKDLNATLKMKEVTKSRVWPRPDYEQLVTDGMHPFTAHLLKQIYDSIATTPSTRNPTDDKLQIYIDTIQKLRESVFSWAKDIQQQRDLLDRMTGQASAEQSAQTFGSPVQISALMKSTDYSIIRQVWPSPGGIGAFRDAKNKESLFLVGGNKLFGALQPGYDEAKRAIDALKEGWPAQQEAWQKRFTIKEVPVGEKIYSREGARTLTEPEFWIMRKSKASRFGNIVETGLKTREEAIEKAKSLAERKEKDGGEEEMPLNLEGLQRVGVERRAKGENISPAAFKDAFGFRGVNFGNWTNQAERQAHVNLAYDALMDLADVLGIPPKALSLDGLLGVAFGAQGSGKYAAHFVPGVNEINLTKTRGAGALAHEWAHAVDHYFAVQAGEKYAKSTDPFLTHLSQVQSATIRPEVVDAFKTIVKTMKQRDQTAEEIKQGYSEKLARAEKGLRSWTDVIEKRIPEEKRGPVSKLIERIKMGDVGDGYVKAGKDSAFRTRIHELREAYKVAMGNLLPKEEAQAIQNWGNSLEFARKAQSPQGHIPQKSTSYLINAEKFDKDKGGKEYWTQPTEMFARAFQSYVMDRLDARAERNDYLTRPQKEDSPAYPQGEERTAINAAFDKLVDTIQTKETDKGIALFEERNAERAEPTMAQFEQAFKEGVTITGMNQKIIDSSQEFPKEMIKALSTKRYVRQLTAELGKVFNAMKRVLVQSDPETFETVTFAALSPDSYYYGVNLRGPDQMILNPWTALYQVQQGVQEGFIGEDEVPEYLAGNLIKTLVHEFTHQQVTTTHQDERQPYFLAAEQRNRAILGSRLAMMQRQLMAVLTGGTNGTVEGIRADLKQQQAFWKKGDGLSAMDQSVSPEPSYARRRQGVSGEGASGRTGPPTYLRGGGESQTLPLDESPGLQRSRTIDIDGTSRQTTNSKGQPIASTPEAIRNFWRWFGNSVVVDGGGRPLVVYHGTAYDGIESFRPNGGREGEWQRALDHFRSAQKENRPYGYMNFRGGTFFSPDPSYAGNYTAENTGVMYPVYIKAENPVYFDQVTGKSSGVDAGRTPDALILREGDKINEVAVIDPTQIKSATGNRGTFDPKDARIQFSKREPETSTIDPIETREKLSAAKSSLRPYLLGALGLEQLSQVYGDAHAEVHQYNKATQAMEADFTEMSRESDKVARAWTELNIPVADKMAKVMEDARFLNFDPDPRKKQEADSAKKQELRTRFEQLPDEAKSVYRMARDFYTNMAEDRFQALKERIERAGGTPENTRKLVDRLQIAYEQVRSKVYFPFTRFGENIVVAKKMENGVEKDREVHAFESVAEAQKFATMMKLKGWQVKQTVAREYSVDKEGPASKIVRQMHDIIKELGQGQQGLPGVLNLEDQLLDSLNQSFLQALPDMSYAKHFIHAKDVKGASRDALRSFAHSALHGAHHISRIRHADQVTKALLDLDTKINETVEGDTTEARQVYNELIKRHNDIMNPNTHPFSAWLGQLGFTMSLGGVVATGITNATQVPLVTYPWLGARYGFGKASTALARAYRDFLDPRTLNKDSLFDATAGLEKEIERLSKMPAKQKVEALKDEVKMLKELARRGHIDLTQTMDLAGLSSRDNLSRKARTLGTVGEKVTRMLGFTFHVPEVMNRQVTALSTFRLEKEKGGSFDEALERAQQAIIDTHFLYQSFNRPRYMQGNFLRVLTMFRQYSQNIAYTYGRAASIWLDKNNATKEERAVAKRQLLSMLALQFGAAGALGMPFFGTPIDLLMAVVAAMGDDDEKRDWEVALRQWLDGQATSLAEAFIDDKEQARAVGKELAEVVAHGASRLTPFDMASRLGQNDLFFREPQREREGRQAVMDWGLALGGPVPSYFLNFLLGMGDVAKGMNELNAGFFMRGVEELTPAVLRNGVRSLRYTLEGVRTRDEYKQLDLNTSEKLGQLFGFTPSKVAEMYEATTAVKNKEHRILNEQKDLKNRFARAVDDQDDNAKQRTLEAIRGFNERNPMFAITSNTLNRSLKTRRQHEAGMERGMYLPPRRRGLLEEGDFGDY